MGRRVRTGLNDALNLTLVPSIKAGDFAQGPIFGALLGGIIGFLRAVWWTIVGVPTKYAPNASEEDPPAV